MAGTEIIEWYLAEDTQPDEGITVLLHVPDAPEPVWPGYLDGDEWRWVDGSSVEQDVVEWADMPVGSSVDEEPRWIWGLASHGLSDSMSPAPVCSKCK